MAEEQSKQQLPEEEETKQVKPEDQVIDLQIQNVSHTYTTEVKNG